MENNGKGLFYGVIGVATLIVAIIGATFAYFSATAEDTTTVTGETAEVGLSLDVQPISTGKGGLIPQNTAGLSTAVKNSCVDGNSNTVCQVYSITITNTGTAGVTLNGTLSLAAETGSTFTNLKWAPVTGVGNGNSLTNAAAGTAATNTTLASNVQLTAAGGQTPSATFYVVVYIEETGSPQESDDKGSFKGTVSFNGADNDVRVTSTFVS